MIPVSKNYSYYAEETTLQAPGSRTQPSGTGMKLYGRDLRDYDDNDLETLLGKLSTDELEDLNNDFDPDVGNFLKLFKYIYILRSSEFIIASVTKM